MKLAGQLLAVSAVTLLLPWAGCQYAREVETALRDGEQQAIVSTARLLGAALAPAAAGLAADAERWSAGRGRGWTSMRTRCRPCRRWTASSRTGARSRASPSRSAGCSC
jgi:hypothetical protein